MKSDYVVTYPVKGIRPLCLSAQEKKFINTKKNRKQILKILQVKHNRGMRLWNIGEKLSAKGDTLIEQGYTIKGRMLVAEGENIKIEGVELMVTALDNAVNA